MLHRDIQEELKIATTQYPVVALLGPRQAGKTTVLKAAFPHYTYVLLEDLDKLDFALSDPKGFLNQYSNEHGLIIDEAQKAPLLFSYLQGIVDEQNIPGKFILSGSQNFYLSEQISQTLAGRVCILTLLPLSLSEIKASSQLPNRYEDVLFQGQYPRVYANHIDHHKWYLNYIRTYIERDVRQIKQVADLHLFQKFLGLCAGRVGHLLNLSELSRDCGITTKTATSWISILEASYLIFLLYPYHKNFNKRLVKSPKLYFFDTGVACALLKISTVEQLTTHYLKGALFESFVLSELLKERYNKGLLPHIYFWRDQSDHEVDCLMEDGIKTTPIEIKSSETINSKFFDTLQYWSQLANQDPSLAYLIYGGHENQKRSMGQVLGWHHLDMIQRA
jgi:predicted AAA+ superfamily ATPase